ESRERDSSPLNKSAKVDSPWTADVSAACPFALWTHNTGDATAKPTATAEMTTGLIDFMIELQGWDCACLTHAMIMSISPGHHDKWQLSAGRPPCHSPDPALSNLCPAVDPTRPHPITLHTSPIHSSARCTLNSSRRHLSTAPS